MNAAAGARCTVFHGEDARSLPNLDDISSVLQDPQAFVWLDLVDPTERELDVLRSEFPLHPLAIEDAVKAHQRSKVDAYPNCWFVVAHAASHKGNALTVSEIAIFAGERFVVTVRHDPPYPLDVVQRRWTSPTLLRKDSGALVYTILDTIVDGYFPVVEAFEQRVQTLEEELLAPRSRATTEARDILVEILRMKKQLLTMRRVVSPIPDMVGKIVRGDVKIFSDDESVYYHDVADHALRMLDRVEGLRDMLGSALDVYTSTLTNRQGEISKRLTIIASIFLPLSFITGFFGQNFGFLVEHITTTKTFWIYGVGAEVAAVIALLLYFKYKRWY